MTTEELLEQLEAEAQSETPVCVIDPETRTITVPPEYQLFGVENDKRVERIYFQCPKIVGDNQDLSQDYILFINYVNANGDPDAYKINDMQVEGDNITFSWLLEENVTLYQGNIQISFCGIIPGDEQEDPDKNRWGTTINTDCTVLTGLKCTQQVAESNPDALAQIWATIDELKAGGGGGGTTDYNNLSNLPQINDVTLKGNKTLDDIGAQSKIIFDASKNGVRTENSGLQNSQALQSLIDTVSANGGGSIYIPSGQYQFSSNGTQNIGEHCIKMKSNVTIFGDGSSTILKPTGTVQNGLDMFYWNEYADSDSPTYIENCIFRDFVIDGAGQHSTNYTSAGKGFMLNLIKNCHWDNVTVKNMDATGFGVDCPIGCTIKNCEAVNNGKQAQATDVGASGFGIGFGYSYDESMIISDCLAIGNKKFGIFFEHQRRFSEEGYESTTNRGFLVVDCIAKQNYYNYGTEQGINVEYSNCISWNALQHGFFFRNSEECLAKSCTSYAEGDTSFVILADYTDGGTQENKDNGFFGCVSKYCKYGAKIVNSGSSAAMQRNVVKDCFLNLEQTNTIMTSGTMDSLFIEGNISNGAENSFSATVTDFVNKNNSWNSEQSAYELPIMSSAQLGGGKAVAKTDKDVPVAVDSSTGQLFVPTYPESASADIDRQEMSSSNTVITLEPNKLYVFPEMSSLTVTLGTPSDTNVANEYHFFFTSGATATTLTLNDVLSDTYSIEANMKYEVSILENVAYIKGVSMSET